MKRNPGLAIYGNPPGEVMGTFVYAIEYRHAEDDADYRHDFTGPVEMIAMNNGDILLRRTKGSGFSQSLWEDF